MQDDIILSVLKAVAQDDDVKPDPSEQPDPPEQSQQPEAEAAEPSAPRSMRWNLPGFCAKTKVSTSFGELPVEALRLRDPVKTVSGAYKKVAWIDRIHLDEGFLKGFPDACPIRMQRSALGPNSPRQNLVMSPGQMVVVPQEWSDQKRATAGDLEGRPNIDRMLTTNLTYYMFHCGEPELVQVDGVWCAVGP